MQILDKIYSQPPVSLSNCTREAMRSYFVNTWDLYEWLFSSIVDDTDLYANPDPLRNPLIFYMGHTAVFYINKLVATGALREGIHPEFEHLFAVGVDPEASDDLETKDLWPAADEVREYRKKVYDQVLAVINTGDFSAKIHWDHPLWALFMGLEHDRIHFETSSVLIRQYPVASLQHPPEWTYAPTVGKPVPNELITITGGKVVLGRPSDSHYYGWDNEYGAKEVEVEDFAVTHNMISNAEYLNFVNAGGYDQEKLWTEKGWQWRTEYKMDHPKFWVREGDEYQYRAMFDVLSMPLDWPAEVTCHEARAYCAWKGSAWRLLKEKEWRLIADQTPQGEKIENSYRNYNLNMATGSPMPVGALRTEGSGPAVNDIFGNVWDWLDDDFYQLPDYCVHPIYKDFSEPYFGEDHGMLAGGAWATTGTGASKFYRLWFRRGFHQHAGFRLAKSL